MKHERLYRMSLILSESPDSAGADESCDIVAHQGMRLVELQLVTLPGQQAAWIAGYSASDDQPLAPVIYLDPSLSRPSVGLYVNLPQPIIVACHGASRPTLTNETSEALQHFKTELWEPSPVLFRHDPRAQRKILLADDLSDCMQGSLS